MSTTRSTLAAGIAIALIAVGCAPVRTALRFEASGDRDLRVWPAPQTQELARYRYIGELTGEANFRDPGGEGMTARGVLGWLVGLSERPDDPVVLQRPQSGVVDERGRILVTDVSRRAVFVFDEPGGVLEVWDEAAPNLRFESPIGIALGRGGELLVTDAELARVFRFDASGKPLGAFGEGVLRRPTGIARDAARGLVYVADTHAHDVKVFDDTGALVDTLGQRGDQLGEFNYPTHVAFVRGTLFVTDVLNSRVQGLAATGEVRSRFGERGLYVGNLVRPKGVAADDEGNLYVVESLYDTLLVFDREARLLLTIGGTGKDVGKFFLPAGVWVDARNRVFVADMFNGRVVVFQFLGGS